MNSTVCSRASALLVTTILAIGCMGVSDDAENDLLQKNGLCPAGKAPFALTAAVQKGGQTVIRKDLRVVGSLSGSRQIAVRSVVVAGVPATALPAAFNFSQWEVVIPVHVLAALAATSGTEAACPGEDLSGLSSPPVGSRCFMVQAAVFHACRDDGADLHNIGIVRVDPSPEIEVQSCAIQPADMLLAANGNANLTVTANASADGAEAILKVDKKLAFPGLSSPISTILRAAEDGKSAFATLVAAATGETGEMTITAQAKGMACVAANWYLQGPPEFSIKSATIPSGAKMQFYVKSRFDLACATTASRPELAGTLALPAQPLAGSKGQGALLTVEVPKDVTEGTVDLRCEDEHGQAATIQFQLVK